MKASTRELKFALGVGKAGLKIWKGKQLAEVRAHLARIEAELEERKRQGDPDA